MEALVEKAGTQIHPYQTISEEIHFKMVSYTEESEIEDWEENDQKMIFSWWLS